MFSIVLADFFRKYPKYFEDVESFFHLEDKDNSGTEKLKDYILTFPSSILKSFKRVIPQNMYSVFDIENWGWFDELIGVDGKLTTADEKIRNEYNQLQEYYNTKEEEWKNTQDQNIRDKCNKKYELG